MLALLEVVFVGGFLVFMASQFFLPLFQGRPVFWAFTKEGRRQVRLEERRARLRRELKLSGLQEEVDELESRLSKVVARRIKGLEAGYLSEAEEHAADKDPAAARLHELLDEAHAEDPDRTSGPEKLTVR